MRHLVNKSKLGRTKSHREAMLRNQITSLILYGKIETTLAKARFLRSNVEKLITRAKIEDTIHNRRIARKVIQNKDALNKLFKEIGPKFKNRNGGYTRIIKTGFRKGDDAPMAVIEILSE
jgi:large subunit ribosomal protein L17